jgi:biotin carboxyl carrier protein
MKRYQISLDGRTFDVRLLSDPMQEQVEVDVDGRTLTVQVTPVLDAEEAPPPEKTPSSAPVAIAGPGRAAAGPPTGNRVMAPLPGVIKSVAVSAGQKVAVGDELLVIEAMKMANVLRASQDGVVRAVHAIEGHHVAHGDLLLEYQN